MDKNYCPICEMKFSRKDVLMRKIRNAYPQTTEVYPPPTLPQKEVIPLPPPPSHIPLERSSQSRPCSEQKYQDRFTFQHPFTMTVTGATFCGKKTKLEYFGRSDVYCSLRPENNRDLCTGGDTTGMYP
ncbi:Hypothetical predicted protein [Mytilus galloprovincialis]|uniref:Uncharacterized protein n=1 Tax=Mytilus galloprovincialis TaxID=29158 RepID=A0A8B6BM24_MYTGA|nr:Hypothetical predicted protein [Mytilus galloprovincialis]